MAIDHTISLVAWILFCSFEGIRDGAVFSHNSSNCNGRYPFNIHYFFIPVRGVVLGGISMGIIDMLANWAMFSFLHNGFYYETRRLLEPNNEKLFGYRFWGKSSTTTAKRNITFIVRSVGMIGGVTIHILIVVL